MLQLTFIAYVVFVIAATLVPEAGMGVTVYKDKVVHLIAYFAMGVLAWVAVTAMWRRLYLLFFSVVLGIALEFLQEFVPGRSMDAADAAANAAGVVLAYLVCRFCELYVGWGTYGIKDGEETRAGETK